MGVQWTARFCLEAFLTRLFLHPYGPQGNAKGEYTMRIVGSALVLSGLMLGSAFDLQADAIAEIQNGEEGGRSIERIQGGDMPGMAPMRIEDPDGTMRPLPQATMPESRMSTEGLKEVPDAGGGTMVNVEGRFQSILKVPEGSDNAIHGHTSEDLQPLKP
jgi:hypothetical protein